MIILFAFRRPLYCRMSLFLVTKKSEHMQHAYETENHNKVSSTCVLTVVQVDLRDSLVVEWH